MANLRGLSSIGERPQLEIGMMGIQKSHLREGHQYERKATGVS